MSDAIDEFRLDSTGGFEMGERRDYLGQDVGGLVCTGTLVGDVGGRPGFVECFDRTVEHSVQTPPVALDDALEIGVNGAVTGIDAVGAERGEPVERPVERSDGSLDAAVETGMESHRPKRLDSHIAGNECAFLAQFDRKTAVIGLVAGRVNRPDWRAADVEHFTVIDPDIDRFRWEEVTISFERFDGLFDSTIAFVTGETRPGRVLADGSCEVLRVAPKPLADAGGSVHCGVGRRHDGSGLSDVVDVWVGEDELFDVREVVVDGRECLPKPSFGIGTRHAGIDERRPLAVDEVARHVAGRPVDVEFDAVDGNRPLVLGHYRRESRSANKRNAPDSRHDTSNTAQ